MISCQLSGLLAVVGPVSAGGAAGSTLRSEPAVSQEGDVALSTCDVTN